VPCAATQPCVGRHSGQVKRDPESSEALDSCWSLSRGNPDRNDERRNGGGTKERTTNGFTDLILPCRDSCRSREEEVGIQHQCGGQVGDLPAAVVLAVERSCS